MKTSVIMTRKMGDFEVLQRTSDSMFNATKLLEQWNKSNPDNQRRLDKFWESTHLPELMEEIVKNEYSNTVGITELNKDSYTPKFGELKKMLCKTKSGRHNGGTWMHPVLFVKFAMYLNPRFEYQVLKFVQDEMIKHRNNAGDAYSRLASSIQSLVGANSMKTLMPNVSKGINYVVFNNHCTGERNKHGEQDKQQELYALEIKISELIDEGFLKSYEQVMQYLRERWAKKYTPKALRK